MFVDDDDDDDDECNLCKGPGSMFLCPGQLCGQAGAC